MLERRSQLLPPFAFRRSCIVYILVTITIYLTVDTE